MSIPPVRPVFSNGQRLTAERLTQAQEYLRDFVRRICLAPLSAGVAGGFDLELEGGPAVDATTLLIKPGMAIDGKGRLLIVPEEVSVPLATVLANAGILEPHVGGQGARIAVQMDPPPVAECGDQTPPCVVEAARIFFEREDFDDTFPEFNASVSSPNCVEPWEDISDAESPDPVACSITLGNVYYSARRGVYVVTTFFRQGVEPRFSVLRNTRGQPAIFLTDLSVDTNNLQPLASPVAGVGVPVPALFTSVTAFRAAGGVFLQATQVGPFGKQYAAGSYGQGDGANSRVFVFGGGTGPASAPQVPAGLGGAAAVPCTLIGGDIDSAGIPLQQVAGTTVPGQVQVEAVPPGSVGSETLLGLSAGPQYSHGSGQAVLLATTGILRAKVVVPAGDALSVGQRLQVNGSPAHPQTLSAVGGPGVYIVAAASQGYDNSSGSNDAVADLDVWVQHPPVLNTGSLLAHFEALPVTPKK